MAYLYKCYYINAFIGYDKTWEREFDGIVSKRDKTQYMKFNQLKLKVHDTYNKDEKTKTKFETLSDE